MWPWRRLPPRKPAKTVIAGTLINGDNETRVYVVHPSDIGVGVVFYGDKPSILYPGGQMTETRRPNAISGSQWRPHTGWSDLELVVAGFPPPPAPHRPVIEQLAIAVLGGDKAAWAPLVDAALEELARGAGA